MGSGRFKANPRDLFSYQLLIDEGVFIGRLLNQHEFFPESAAHLALISVPLLSVTEHDAIPFLNKKFGTGLSAEDPRITRIRHTVKSLDSRMLDFRKYSEEAHAVIEKLNEQFYSTGKPWSPLLNFFRKNVGIAFYSEMPIYANYSTMHLMTKNNPSLLQSRDNSFEKKIGYEIGFSGAAIYAIAEQFVSDSEVYRTNKFQVQANEWKYEELVAPLKKKGIEEEATFFFFSELLSLLTSVPVLRKAGFLNPAIYLKYSAMTLDLAWRSIVNFAAYARTDKTTRSFPANFLNEVGRLLNRDEKKFIKKARPLRNAMVHYDFTRELVPDGLNESNPWTVMDAATLLKCGMTVDEFSAELFRVRNKLADAIANLVCFPPYDPSRRPWGW